MFAACQEGAWKDMERTLGVLKARFHILATPDHSFSHQVLSAIIRAYIILNNMIIEDEHGGSYDVDNYETIEFFTATPPMTPKAPMRFAVILRRETTLHAKLVLRSTPK
jgi:hypothetical protein